MLTLLLVFLFFMFITSVMASSARRRAIRRRREHEEMQRRLAAEQGGDAALNPFAGMPFGSLFEQMLGPQAQWGRSMMYDEATGQWVDVTEQPVAPEESIAPPETRADATEQERRAAAKRRRRQQAAARPAQGGLASLLGGGLGGGMGGNSGTFEVQHPDELQTFEDVGGMEKLKQEVSDTVTSCTCRPAT